MNGHDLVAKMGGISRAESERIWADVQANHRLLESCPRHRFVAADTPPPRPPARSRKWKCTTCTGVVDLHAYIWYERGLAHAPNAQAAG